MANKHSPAKKWYPDPALVRKRIKEMGRAFEACFPNQELPNNGLGRKWGAIYDAYEVLDMPARRIIFG